MTPRINSLLFAPAIALVTLGTLSSTAQAVPFTLNDTTVGEPVWNRPLPGTPPTALSGVGTATPYDVFNFTVDAAGSYTFLDIGTAPVNWDNFTVLYQNSFNAGTPLVNAIIANDDNPNIGMSGFTSTLAVGTQYYFITTGFGNTNTGAYTLTVNGPGNVLAVPEPSTYAMMAGGIGLLLVGQRFRRATRLA